VSVSLSVSLSHQSNAAAACVGFAAERRTRKRYRSTALGARQQQHRSPGPQHGELVWNLCPDGNMHEIIYRHIGRTGLERIDGQKSPVFRRGKSGNPSAVIKSRGIEYRVPKCKVRVKTGILSTFFNILYLFYISRNYKRTHLTMTVAELVHNINTTWSKIAT